MRHVAVAIGLAALLIGCDRRVAQCNLLVDAINEEQPKLAKAVSRGAGQAPTPEALESFAKTLDTFIVKLKAIQLKDEKLVGFRESYTGIAVGLAAAARNMAAKFDDQEQAIKAAKELNAFPPKEKALIKEINDYCQGRGG
jgi:hypothetical protein